MTIHETIRAYYKGIGEDDGERSWGHCYRYFHSSQPSALNCDLAALHLGFYLASWGMYRKGFLRKYAYTVHKSPIEKLSQPQFLPLWKHEFGTGKNDSDLVPLVLEAISAVRVGYGRFAPETGPTDTLVTKVLLGTFGCLPACDTYFARGFKNSGFKYEWATVAFVENVLQFCQEHYAELREEQEWVEATGHELYPVMKLVDMHFWQIGFELSKDASRRQRGDLLDSDQLPAARP